MHSAASIIEKPNSASVSSVLLSNSVPFFGVMFWGWTFYSVLLVFWFETLCHTAFVILRVCSAKVNSGHSDFALFKFKKSMQLLLARTGILLFYLLFIVIFIGMLNTKEEEMVHTLANMVHGERYLLWALLAFTLAGIVEYVFHFRLNGKYLQATPESEFKVVDARFIVIHLVIVLGAFASEIITKDFKLTDNSGHVLVTIFVLIKIAVDLVGHAMKNGLIKLKVEQA